MSGRGQANRGSRVYGLLDGGPGSVLSTLAPVRPEFRVYLTLCDSIRLDLTPFDQGLFTLSSTQSPL